MLRIYALCAVLLISTAAAAPAAQTPITGSRPAAAPPFRASAIASFDNPWALAFLPDGRMLVTE